MRGLNWKGEKIARKRLAVEQIATKLRQIEVLLGQGKTIAKASKKARITDQNYYRWQKENGGLEWTAISLISLVGATGLDPTSRR